MILHPVDVVRDGNLAATGLRRAEQLCVVVALISVLMLCAYPNWLIDARGLVVATDFVGEWAAGQLAVEGHPAAAYDWTVHKRAEINALGHEFDGDFPWCYPPPFLFVVAALARLPYLAAFAVWMAVTWVAFGIVLRGIIGHRFGFLLAAAFPATMFNIAVGQNGFLTAALIGGSLLLLDKRPMVAGLFLGMLTYKPHL